MKHFCVAIRDSALNAYMRPFYSPTTASAVRSFRDEVNRRADDNNLNRHPDDYELWLLAVFEDETGTFIQEGGPERLARAKDLIQG